MPFYNTTTLKILSAFITHFPHFTYLCSQHYHIVLSSANIMAFRACTYVNNYLIVIYSVYIISVSLFISVKQMDVIYIQIIIDEHTQFNLSVSTSICI